MRFALSFLLICCVSIQQLNSQDTPLSKYGKESDSLESSFELHPSPSHEGQCRYWAGYTDPMTFHHTACSSCYSYLFPKKPMRAYKTMLYSLNSTIIPTGTFVTADHNNATITDKICQTLDSATSCRQWLACCDAAVTCCEGQLKKYQAGGHRDSGECPGTWDGFDCWDEASAGDVVQASCPWYIPHAMPAKDAIKTCTVNGTWHLDPGSMKEWTDYTGCLSFEEFRITFYIKMVCNGLSLLALIPSLIIFFAYRGLRKQHRVRLHINLFVSFVLYAVINILWEVLVVYEQLNNKTGVTLMDSNTVGCKMLYFLTRYARSTNFLWMFCEGLYLHRLIVKAFTPPKRLILFYTFGWVFPLVPTVTYSILRIFKKDQSCWVDDIGHYEWIIYVPNLLALVTNLVFLFDILRILLTQLQSHPNEPSNYRRALKATFVLIPLFGLQLFLIIYKPPLGSVAGTAFEYLSAVVVNLQGLCVALIFCLFNGEVMSNLRRTCGKYLPHTAPSEARTTRYMLNTQTSDAYTKDPPSSSFHPADPASGANATKGKDYMAMKRVDGPNNGYLK